MCESNITLRQIDSDLNIRPMKNSSPGKIRVYTEDSEAVEFAKSLLGNRYKKLVDFVNVKIGCKELITLATKRRVPEFTDSLIILDGDNSNSAKNIISLPGGDENLPPDQLAYKFLKDLPEADLFWPGYEKIGEYSKQACFLNYPDLSFTEKEVREKFKRWYNEQREFWGRGSSHLYTRWKKDNGVQVSKFLEDFRKAYNHLAKKKNLPQI